MLVQIVTRVRRPVGLALLKQNYAEFQLKI